MPGLATPQQRQLRVEVQGPQPVRGLRPVDDPRYAVAVIVEHGGLGGATAGAPRAREVMRVALLKDPEIRARIEKPLPLPERCRRERGRPERGRRDADGPRTATPAGHPSRGRRPA